MIKPNIRIKTFLEKTVPGLRLMKESDDDVDDGPDVNKVADDTGNKYGDFSSKFDFVGQLRSAIGNDTPVYNIVILDDKIRGGTVSSSHTGKSKKSVYLSTTGKAGKYDDYVRAAAVVAGSDKVNELARVVCAVSLHSINTEIYDDPIKFAERVSTGSRTDLAIITEKVGSSMKIYKGGSSGRQAVFTGGYRKYIDRAISLGMTVNFQVDNTRASNSSLENIADDMDKIKSSLLLNTDFSDKHADVSSDVRLSLTDVVRAYEFYSSSANVDDLDDQAIVTVSDYIVANHNADEITKLVGPTAASPVNAATIAAEIKKAVASNGSGTNLVNVALDVVNEKRESVLNNAINECTHVNSLSVIMLFDKAIKDSKRTLTTIDPLEEISRVLFQKSNGINDGNIPSVVRFSTTSAGDIPDSNVSEVVTVQSLVDMGKTIFNNITTKVKPEKEDSAFIDKFKADFCKPGDSDKNNKTKVKVDHAVSNIKSTVFAVSRQLESLSHKIKTVCDGIVSTYDDKDFDLSHDGKEIDYVLHYYGSDSGVASFENTKGRKLINVLSEEKNSGNDRPLVSELRKLVDSYSSIHSTIPDTISKMNHGEHSEWLTHSIVSTILKMSSRKIPADGISDLVFAQVLTDEQALKVNGPKSKVADAKATRIDMENAVESYSHELNDRHREITAAKSSLDALIPSVSGAKYIHVYKGKTNTRSDARYFDKLSEVVVNILSAKENTGKGKGPSDVSVGPHSGAFTSRGQIRPDKVSELSIGGLDSNTMDKMNSGAGIQNIGVNTRQKGPHERYPKFYRNHKPADDGLKHGVFDGSDTSGGKK
jgi:hypothetical protein